MKHSLVIVIYLVFSAMLVADSQINKAYAKNLPSQLAAHADLLKAISVALDIDDIGTAYHDGSRTQWSDTLSFKAKPKGQNGAYTLRLAITFLGGARLIPKEGPEPNPRVTITELQNGPNQTLEPTPLRVTPAADAPVAPRSVVAHL